MAQYENLIADLEARVAALEALPTAKAELEVIATTAVTLTLQQQADAATAQAKTAADALALAQEQEAAAKAKVGGSSTPISSTPAASTGWKPGAAQHAA